MAQEELNDHWSSSAYAKAAAFVPQLSSTVLGYLDAQAHDNILDIGCGDGQLTMRIAAAASQGAVLGLDASPSMIRSAEMHASTSNCSYRVQDCRALLRDAPADVLGSGWDKVFSNAALHWILRDAGARDEVYAAIHAALKPGGAFVFEQGGAGNVAECRTAMVAALIAHGVPPDEARNASPWFFASEGWVRRMLEKHGFVVDRLETEYRPTQTTPDTADGKGGLQGWVRLMCAGYLAKVEEGRRDEVVRWAVGVLEDAVTREDGSQWIGYVRLRGVARKAL